MIDRQEISKALRALDPQDREILDYSLRRRVPDADLATIFASSAGEVARRRAAAIEQLSTALGAQRGADLGDVLKALLEADTWAGVTGAPEPPAVQRAPAPGPVGAASPVGHKPLGASTDPPPPDPAPEPAAPPAPASARGRRRAMVGAAAALAVLAPAGVVWALTSGDSSAPVRKASGDIGTFSPQNDKAGEPFPADPQESGLYPTARLTKKTVLYDEPGGEEKLSLGPVTEWKSPRILSIVKRRGPWLAVLVPELKNGDVAWVRDDKVGNIGAVNWSIEADLSKRRILVYHDNKVVRRVKIGVGRTDHPTPTGRFAVTDRLRVTDSSSPYGCCVLALTGHQTRLPAGWPGGDRLAIHATRDLSGLGKRVSLGCMRTDPRDTRWMLKRVPLGTPVTIGA